jgi:hypothetical protein
MIPAEIDIRRAFLTALLLTGSAEAAEVAVFDAIAESECDVDELLVATAKCAIRLPINFREECLPRPEISSLPSELQRLFSLSSIGRKCFVLRTLMRLTLEVSHELLGLQSDEFDEALCRALCDLHGLADIPNRCTTIQSFQPL